MISSQTRAQGSLASTYFSISGLHVDVDIDVLLDAAYKMVEKEKNTDLLFKKIIESRMFIMTDFLVGCADALDVGRCERRRDRYFDEIMSQVEGLLGTFLMERYGVSLNKVLTVAGEIDAVLEDATSLYIKRGMTSVFDAIYDALHRRGYDVSPSESPLDVLLRIVEEKGGIPLVKALILYLMVVNYAMAFVMLYLEEHKL